METEKSAEEEDTAAVRQPWACVIAYLASGLTLFAVTSE